MTSEDFFESIQKQYTDNLPFVAYRKPNNTALKGLLQKDQALHLTSECTESGFVFAPFDNNQSSILIPISNSSIISSDFIKLTQNETSNKNHEVLLDQKLHHIEIVDKAIDAIQNNEFQKVVLSRNELVQLENSNPITIFKNLLNTYDSAFVYCWYHPKVGLWLGATPETLLNIEGRRLSTMALAGTQKFNGTLDVAWQNKEKEEQQFVTDFIVSSLKSSVDILKTSEVETVRAGNLLHLKTKITATLKPELFNLKVLIEALHPTPAVCGLPKEAAKQFILENENYDRAFYTGFLGELNFKEKTARNSNRHNVENDVYASIKTISNLFVNLRCMQYIDNQAIIYIGGGITKDSIPENEWDETVSKSQVIKSIL